MPNKKLHYAAKRKREKWAREHPGFTRKSWAKKRREEKKNK